MTAPPKEFLQALFTVLFEGRPVDIVPLPGSDIMVAQVFADDRQKNIGLRLDADVIVTATEDAVGFRSRYTKPMLAALDSARFPDRKERYADAVEAMRRFAASQGAA